MSGRTGLLVAIALLLIEGLSGILVSVTLIGAGFGTSGSVPGVAIAGGMFAYGLALVVGALGIVFGRSWGRILAIAALLAGLGLLAWIAVIGGPDPVILFGIAIWGVTLACLYVGRSTTD